MKKNNILIRTEKKEDNEAIFLVNNSAFGRSDEAQLVDALRGSESMLLSLVAVQQGKIIGHVLFTSVKLRSQKSDVLIGAGLGPVAVSPDCQRKGVGDTLIRAGISQLKATGVPYVVVLGHSSYYPRFGFEASSRFDIKCQWDVPEEVFMVLELAPGALTSSVGTIYYAPEFDGV